MNLNLADPHFNSSDITDLLSSNTFPQILLDGQIMGCNGASDDIYTVFVNVLIAFKSSTNLTSLFYYIDDMFALDDPLK